MRNKYFWMLAQSGVKQTTVNNHHYCHTQAQLAISTWVEILLGLSIQVGRRSGLIIGMKSTHPPTTPPNLKFVKITLNQGKDIRMPQLYNIECVWKLSWGCLEGIWKVSRQNKDGVGGQLAISTQGQVKSRLVHSGHVKLGQVKSGQIKLGQAWKKLIFVRNPIFVLKNVRKFK